MCGWLHSHTLLPCFLDIVWNEQHLVHDCDAETCTLGHKDISFMKKDIVAFAKDKFRNLKHKYAEHWKQKVVNKRKKHRKQRYQSVKVVLKGEVTQRASASACALRPLPEYVPLISGGQRGSPTEVRGVPEDLVSVEFGGTPEGLYWDGVRLLRKSGVETEQRLDYPKVNQSEKIRNSGSGGTGYDTELETDNEEKKKAHHKILLQKAGFVGSDEEDAVVWEVFNDVVERIDKISNNWLAKFNLENPGASLNIKMSNLRGFGPIYYQLDTQEQDNYSPGTTSEYSSGEANHGEASRDEMDDGDM
ncbi:uncharacterized protein EDB91DRAFT_1077232 [Suillus paluster]|uniref:uncharacterized protein n=1 Tax=Suillus paluster TaxID=48578 RepID=UPI001B87DC43|nr:uncharacterized protein EDB91DRAFT_1077232 [Suillus paluster]KAG1755256.1 hypothetical protein EDB91DRAFT_1077232 [Suillus paluster]